MLRTRHVNVFSEELEEIHFSEGEYKHLFFTFLNVNLWKKCVFYVKENPNMSKTSEHMWHRVHAKIHLFIKTHHLYVNKEE